MIATSAAVAFGPAIDAARSPERRVKMKLTTRTVRHTKAASHSLRTINKIIVEDYDSARVAASADIEPWQRRHPHLPMFSAYARNVLANLPKAYGNDRRSHCVRAKKFITYARSQPEAGHGNGMPVRRL